VSMGHGFTRGIIEEPAGAGEANPPFPLRPSDEVPRRILSSRVLLLGLPGGVVSLRHFAVLVSSSFSPLRREVPVVREMRRLSARHLEAEVRKEAASLASCV
jgi:hypothetical protein